MAEESEVSDTPLPLESAKAALSKVKDGIRWRRVQAKDMEEILTNEVFLSNMTVTTEKGVSKLIDVLQCSIPVCMHRTPVELWDPANCTQQLPPSKKR